MYQCRGAAVPLRNKKNDVRRLRPRVEKIYSGSPIYLLQGSPTLLAVQNTAQLRNERQLDIV